MDNPETIALMFDELLAGFGLSASDGLPEHDLGIVVVGAIVVVGVAVVVGVVVLTDVVVEVETVVVVPVAPETVSIAFVLLLPFTHA